MRALTSFTSSKLRTTRTGCNADVFGAAATAGSVASDGFASAQQRRRQCEFDITKSPNDPNLARHGRASRLGELPGVGSVAVRQSRQEPENQKNPVPWLVRRYGYEEDQRSSSLRSNQGLFWAAR